MSSAPLRAEAATAGVEPSLRTGEPLGGAEVWELITVSCFTRSEQELDPQLTDPICEGSLVQVDSRSCILVTSIVSPDWPLHGLLQPPHVVCPGESQYCPESDWGGALGL